MTTTRDVIKRHPVESYLALTFAISWGEILLVFGSGAVTGAAEPFFTLLLLGYPAMFLAPSLAAILLTGLVYGKAGFHDLLTRLLGWRVAVRWYAVALLTAPLSIVVVLLALSLASSEFRPRLFVEANWFGPLWYGVVAGLATAFFEELGWTGFALPALLARRHGLLSTGLIVGILYAAWNLPIIYLSEVTNPTPGTLPLAIFLPALLFTWQPAYRLLMVWVYDRTRSLLVAMLMAASLVASWTALNNPLTQTQTTLAVFYLVLAVVWCGIAVAVVLGNRGRTSRPAKPTAAAQPT